VTFGGRRSTFEAQYESSFPSIPSPTRPPIALVLVIGIFRSPFTYTVQLAL
jgi:hypothetical protein